MKNQVSKLYVVLSQIGTEPCADRKLGELIITDLKNNWFQKKVVRQNTNT